MPPPPRGPPRRKLKPGEKRSRQEMSASLAGAGDMRAVLFAAVGLVVLIGLVVTLFSLLG